MANYASMMRCKKLRLIDTATEKKKVKTDYFYVFIKSSERVVVVVVVVSAAEIEEMSSL
jgi:hypothetical protein